MNKSIINNHTWKAIGHSLPEWISIPLFGDRKKYGQAPREDDRDWQNWKSFRCKSYNNNSRTGIGSLISSLSYKRIKNIDIYNKNMLEIGPGTIPHLQYLSNKPNTYTILDNNEIFLKASSQILASKGINNDAYSIDSYQFPLQDNSMDIIVAFNTLEHLHPLKKYLEEIKRVLRPNGLIVGGIPTEGGLAWGIGRYFTSRRFYLRNGINFKKIICWTHCNFADDILNLLNEQFLLLDISFLPFGIPSIDFNINIGFTYQNKQ